MKKKRAKAVSRKKKVTKTKPKKRGPVLSAYGRSHVGRRTKKRKIKQPEENFGTIFDSTKDDTDALFVSELIANPKVVITPIAPSDPIPDLAINEVEQAPVEQKKQPWWKKFFSINNKFFSIFVGIIFAGIFCAGAYVLATWNGNPYAPGTILNPECAPTDLNCTVALNYLTATGDASTLNFSTLAGADGAGLLSINPSGVVGVDTNTYLTKTAVYVGTTASTYDGNLVDGGNTGYKAGNSRCATAYTGSHMCSSAEILYTIATSFSSIPSSGTVWISNGPPGYTANANDCAGHTNNSQTYLGSFWDFSTSAGGGAGFLTNCSVLKKLACCK